MPKRAPAPAESARPHDPIDRIEWVHWSTLSANNYNPNVVFTPELRLLELSIVETGWVQPVLATPAHTIIDGFHRWSLSRDSAALQKKYGGLLPVARMDVPESQAMLLTVRMNRAKGSHVALRMSDLVRSLIDEHKLPPEEVARQIGGDVREVDLLYQRSIWKDRGLEGAKYSAAWIPRESGRRAGEAPSAGS